MAAPCDKQNGASAQFSDHDREVLNHLFNPGLPYGDDIDTEQETLNEEVCSEQVVKAKELEKKGVQAAESGNLVAALNLFHSAVEAAPEWPSAYNNRAQALRLQGDIAGARSDLDKAIELSGGHGSAACQAYTQRGLIRRKEGDNDGAKEDLEKAASLGSPFAKQMLVALNPYAALCNQMLGEAIGKLRAGQGEV